MELYEKSNSPTFYIMSPRYERASLAKLYNLKLVTIVYGCSGYQVTLSFNQHDYAFSANCNLGGDC